MTILVICSATCGDLASARSTICRVTLTTDESRKATMEGRAKQAGTSLDEIVTQSRNANPAGRFGTIAEFGAACAFLCSVHAGYIVGQNLLLDGGAYPGTL